MTRPSQRYGSGLSGVTERARCTLYSNVFSRVALQKQLYRYYATFLFFFLDGIVHFQLLLFIAWDCDTLSIWHMSKSL